MDVHEILAGINSLKDQIGNVVSEQNTELKNFGHATKETRDKMYELESRLDEKLALVTALEKKMNEMELDASRPNLNGGKEQKAGLFETITGSKAYTDMKESGYTTMRKVILPGLSAFPE